jgi:cytidylate kinase
VKRVIAIDGPSGAGKSTIARRVASKLGFAYLDTGALYRAVALHLRKRGLDADAQDPEISSVLQETDVRFKDNMIFLNGEDVSDVIRSADAGHYASVFSSRPPVRAFLLDIQRNAAENTDLVAEGRDMTTVVFPEAFKKFYLDASVQERIKRRSLELVAKGFSIDEEKIQREIIERDERDSNRKMAPLKKANDAYIIDTTGHSIENVLKIMIAYIRE